MTRAGATGRGRTCDLLVTNELLYQLSYSGIFWLKSSILAFFAFRSASSRASKRENTNLERFYLKKCLNASITAVNGKDDAGDVGGFFAGEEDGGGIKFAGLAVALHRDMSFGKLLESVGV